MDPRISSSSDVKLKWLQYVVFGPIILYFGRDIFIPICFAALISFVSYPFCVWLEKKGMSRGGAIAVAISILVILTLATIVLLVSQFIDFLRELPGLQEKLGETLEKLRSALSDSFGVSPEQQQEWID